MKTTGSANTRPNILIIMSDQHNARFMGHAGDPYLSTPALDRLTARGASFANAYCPFPICGPSRMSFMTCRTPFENGHWDNPGQLNSSIPTFAHAFLAGGYHTVLSGRMHFVGCDQRHGFAERVIGDTGGTAYREGEATLRRVLGDLYDTPGMSLAGILKSGPGRTGYSAYDEAVTRATVEWIGKRAASGDPSPFLLTVGFLTPHCPFVAPPDDFACYASRVKPEDLPPRGPELHPVNAERRRRYQTDPAPPPDAQWRTRVAYYGLCSFLDRQIGAVIDALEQSGLADNTVVVYTSDHGDMLGEHGMWWKSNFYQDATRVPLIVAWPERWRSVMSPGRRINRIVSLTDVGTSLIDLVGTDPLPGASGRSFISLLKDERAPWDDTAFAEYTTAFGDVPSRMVRRGPWKYNYYLGHRPELYNLADDPGEVNDLWDEPALEDTRRALEDLILRDWNPKLVAEHMERCTAERKLFDRWVRLARPPEPDPPWFTSPPENWVDTTVNVPSGLR